MEQDPYRLQKLSNYLLLLESKECYAIRLSVDRDLSAQNSEDFAYLDVIDSGLFNVQNVDILNVMNVEQINALLARGEIDREDMWPRIVEYESKAAPFPFAFGLPKLPLQPGMLFIRGPRQYGKSTWMDLELRWTIEEFGAGSAFYINGDDLLSEKDFFNQITSLSASFAKHAKVRRLFIDEITAINGWEKILKRAADQGKLKKILVITTGSNARSLRRGSERLPGRKGHLKRTDYIFLPVSYSSFYEICGKELQDDAWIAYLLGGGSPLGLNDIYQFERIPEYLIQIVRDWILGDVVTSGRSRGYLAAVLEQIYRFGGTPVGFTKLARESGLANNTVASGYIEQLADLMTLFASPAIDLSNARIIMRRPAKFHFVNLAGAIAFHPEQPRMIHEFKSLPAKSRAILLEWLVAQELWRRRAIKGQLDLEELGYWQSKENEIDLVDRQGNLVEVKLEKTGPLEFAWFSKTFPNKYLTVVSQSSFETDHIKGLTVHDFLMDAQS